MTFCYVTANNYQYFNMQNVAIDTNNSLNITRQLDPSFFIPCSELIFNQKNVLHETSFNYQNLISSYYKLYAKRKIFLINFIPHKFISILEEPCLKSPNRNFDQWGFWVHVGFSSANTLYYYWKFPENSKNLPVLISIQNFYINLTFLCVTVSVDN